jgi:predicted CXXCH cytochrome family protein
METVTPHTRALVLLVLVLLGAIGTAFAQEPAPAGASPPPAASAPPSGDEVLASGRAPLSNNAQVPLKWLPPGAFEQDRGPSTAIFPPQKLTLRFNHKFHVQTQKLKCESCHKAALSSQSSKDVLTPKPTLCDGCHGTDHSDTSKVQPGDEPSGQCAFCHVGYEPADGNRVARFQIPRPNMLFDHKKHLARNINCQQCHGEVQELELATRDQLPRMRGCFGCHQHPDAAARGDAKSACETCHIRGGATEGGRLKTVFASGTMNPPRWMHNAEHAPDFIQRHKFVAANDSQFCGNCHKDDFCVGCHDGRVRPRSVHPNDYLNMHPTEARLATQRCTSCHREQSFCLNCHMRVGVTKSGPPDVHENGRFHPPKSIWSDPPRQSGHHAYEAMRNLNACVSCHIERDCVVCHGGKGIGAGFNPHSGSFAGGCATQFRRNPRPCLVCHDPGSADLQRCQ